MNRHNALADDLEAIVDRTSLSAVLESLAYVCSEKAEHLLTNWQDETSADAWERCITPLDDLASSASKMGL